jgi:hypothetical protein
LLYIGEGDFSREKERKADLDTRNSLIEKANKQKWEKE